MAFVRFATATGTDDAVVVPLPSSPDSFAPQHATWPSDFTAQSWNGPLPIAVTPLRLETATGGRTSEASIVPLPSSPSPSNPQHRTVPSTSSAQSDSP